jgi:hypothetical protein
MALRGKVGRAGRSRSPPKRPRSFFFLSSLSFSQTKNQTHNNSQGALEPFNLVQGPDAWLPGDFASPDDYTYRLTPDDVRELDGAVRAAAAAAWPAAAGNAATTAPATQDGGEKRNGGGGANASTSSGSSSSSSSDASAATPTPPSSSTTTAANPNTASLLHKLFTSPEQARLLLPTLAPKLEALRREAVSGRGFALLSGFPVGRYTRRETLAGYWLFGLLWGKACSNNKNGHLIGHIKDIGHDPASPETRLYATAAAQPWHNDAADLVSLLCLRNAREGGLSSWASSVSVYNAVLSSHPHLARVLAGPWFMDRKGEVPPGKKPFFEIPVFNFHAGRLAVNISSNYYFLSQRHAEVPRLTPDHVEALQVFHAYAEKLALRAMLQPGDIQLLNNHTCLHHRGAFVDAPGQERHLLRLWMAPPDEKGLPAAYEEIYGGKGLGVGDRGGIRVEGTVECVPEEAE